MIDLKRTSFTASFGIYLIGLVLCFICRVGAAPLPGPEFSIGAPVYVGIPYAQVTPCMAFNGTNHLVVWRDNRDARDFRVYATRVSADGTVLDPDSLPIEEGQVDSYYTAVGSDGTDFLVLWSTSDGDLRGRLVSGAGVVAATNAFVVPNAGGPAIAFNGTHYLVTWTTGGDIRGSRVDRTGRLLEPDGISICSATNYQYGSAVAAVGANWMVAWGDDRREQNGYGRDGDIYGTLVSAAGEVLVPDSFIICATNNRQRYVSLASRGDVCLVAWQDMRRELYTGNDDIYAARVTSAGQVLDRNGFPIASGTKNEWNPAVASDGQGWVVVYSAEIDSSWCNVYGAHVSPQGAVGSAFTLESNTLRQFCNPAVAFGPTNYLAVWDANRGKVNYTIDIVGSRITPAGAVLDTPPVTFGLTANWQFQPAIAGDGTNYLLVWSDGRRGDGRWDIYGARVTASGELLDPDGFAITSLDTAETNPAVAFNGNCFLVVWEDSRNPSQYHNIYGARVSLDGRVLDTNGFAVAQMPNNEMYPSVASNGRDFLVAWGAIVSQYNQKIPFCRVSGSGQLLDSVERVVSIADGWRPSPKVASNGTNYCIVWGGSYSSGFVLVNGDGSILANSPAPGLDLVNAGGDFLSVYSSHYGVYGGICNERGVVSTNFQIAITHYNAGGYSYAFAGNGFDYLLAYNPHESSNAVYVTQITRTGRVIDGNGVVAATGVFAATGIISQTELALAGNKREYLMAYSKLNPFLVPRLYAKVLHNQPRLVDPECKSDRFSFTLEGSADRSYEIEASDDLSSWNTIGQVTNEFGRVRFSDDSDGGFRSYRARRVE